MVIAEKKLAEHAIDRLNQQTGLDVDFTGHANSQGRDQAFDGILVISQNHHFPVEIK